MKKPRRLIIFAIIIVIVVVLSAGAAILLSRHNNNSSTSQGSKKVAVAPQELPAEKTADAADKLAYSGNVAAGTKALDNAIKSTTNTQDQFIYYSSKANLLLNNNDPKDALVAALQAYNLQKTSDSAALVGQISGVVGDKQQSLEYYKKALSLVDPTDPVAKDDTAYYQSIVTSLEKGA
jgi:tetratricopeptide (TPR) repeat protein